MTPLLLLAIAVPVVPYAQPATGDEPQLSFSDRFSEDTRTEYRLQGDVGWELGVIQLGVGSSIERDINGGPWVTVDVDLELSNPAGSKSAECRIWILFDEAPPCVVRLRRLPGDDPQVVSIGLMEIEDKEGEPVENLIRETRVTVSDAHHFQLTWRHGVVRVLQRDESVFAAHIEDRHEPVRAVRTTAVSRPCRIKSWSVSCSPPEATKSSDARKQRIAEATRGSSRMVKAYREGRIAEAVRIGEEVLKIRQEEHGNESIVCANTLNSLGTLCSRLQQTGRAESYYKEAIRIRASVLGEWHPLLASSLNNLALLYTRTGDYAAAEPRQLRALAIRREIFGTRHPAYASSLNNLAGLYSDMGDYSRSEPLFRAAAEAYKSAFGPKHPAYAGTLHNLAALLTSNGDFVHAEPAIREVIEVRKAALGEDHVDYGKSLLGLGVLYSDMGDSARAESLYQEAAQIIRAAVGEKHPDYGVCLNNLGHLYDHQGDYARAEPLYLRNLEIAKERGETHTEYATALNNLGMLYQRMDGYDRAEPLLRGAADIWKLHGEQHPNYARSLNNLALLYQRMGDPKRAELLFTRASEIWKSVHGDEHRDYALSLYNLAGIHHGNGDHARAVPLVQTAVEITRRNLDRSAPVQSARQQKCDQLRGRLFLDRRLTLGGNTSGSPRQLLETLWQWKGAVTFRQQAYRSVAANPELAPVFRSLQAASRKLSAIAARAPIPPADSAGDAAGQAWEQRRAQWETEFAAANQERESLERQIAAGSAEFREAHAPLSIDAVQQTLPPRTAFIDFLEYEHRSPSPARAGHTESEQRYVAFVLRSDREPEMIRLGAVATLSSAITSFRRPFTGGNRTGPEREAANDAADRLRQELWMPLARHLAGIETVVISPDTVLGTLPFAALPGRDANTWLLEEYRFVSLPLAAMLRPLARPPESIKPGLLVLGDVDYSASSDSNAEAVQLATTAEHRQFHTRGNTNRQWARLPGFRDELNSIRSLHKQRFGSDSSIKTLSGGFATEDSLLRHASNYGTLHIITHGYFEQEGTPSLVQAYANRNSSGTGSPNPFLNTWSPGLLSGLVLAGANTQVVSAEQPQDGILRAAEIESWAARDVDLVVLSACETGLGAVAGGEGLTGLQRAFHIAGARSVVASLWKVDDRATLELMKRFYTNLWIRKESRIDALRNAQLSLLRNPVLTDGTRLRGAPIRRNQAAVTVERSTTRTDPLYWAAFILSGDWR